MVKFIIGICHTQNDKPIGSTFYVSLNHQPTEIVNVDYNVSNVDIAYIETDDSKKVTRTSLEFTPLNWNIKQKIHIVGNQIPELTNDTSYHIDFNTSSKDSHFSKLKNQMYCTHHASQTKMDDDSNIEQSKSFINFSGVNLDGGTTFYNDDVKTFYVSLNKKPASEVKLHFVHRPLSRYGMPNLSAYFCDKNGAGIAISGYMTLTFTPDNYNIPQALHFRADKNSRSAIFEHRILLKDVMTDDRDFDISNVKGLILRFAHQYSG